jgi:uncharacterized protein YjbI with pentapeptide repeats
MEGEIKQGFTMKKITQAEFNFLYVSTLDDPIYRPALEDAQHFYLKQLLSDHGCFPDLTGLCLRNLNLRYADFSGLNLTGTDLSGSVCHYANFSDAICDDVLTDDYTRFYHSILTEAQLLQMRSSFALAGDVVSQVEFE